MNFTELRLKIKRFFRRNRRLIIIILIIWAIIFLINYIIQNRPKQLEPSTTYTMHASVMDSGSTVPQNMRSSIEDMIKEYVDCCNEGNYQKAFNMLSEDCREYGFNNDVEKFMQHVLVKMPTPKKYSVQNYSNMKLGNKRIYIYEVKFLDDILATGLTGSDYRFTTDKITFYQGKDGIEMNVGNYIYHEDIKAISENEYLKIDVVDKIVNYSIETYQVKVTNKSKYTVVVSDGAELDEVIINLPNEFRNRSELDPIVLAPGESQVLEMTFKKFVDDGDDSLSLVFSQVRVMEKYSGVDDVENEVIQSEIDNAIAKFSMEVNLK